MVYPSFSLSLDVTCTVVTQGDIQTAYYDAVMGRQVVKQAVNKIDWKHVRSVIRHVSHCIISERCAKIYRKTRVWVYKKKKKKKKKPHLWRMCRTLHTVQRHRTYTIVCFDARITLNYWFLEVNVAVDALVVFDSFRSSDINLR